MIYDSIIIGSGPAGLTAALYNARANMKVLCIEGVVPGGQLMITTEVENYPGFPKGVTGPELIKLMREQAERFGTTYVTQDVTSVDFSQPMKKVFVGKDVYESKTVIIATGAKAKWLDVPGEKDFQNKGISACATCDGFFFKGKKIIVVGGGDTAMEEATFLTRYADKVTVVHRRNELRASKIMQQRAFDNKKIDFIWDTTVAAFKGTTKLESVVLKNLKTNVSREMPIEGAFMAIGHDPVSGVFKDHIEIDEKGYIVRKEFSMTSVPGVFVSGDVYDHRYKQAITAAGYGCEAAIDAEKWLVDNANQFQD
jgi:thioredoxin reductase (NADPH)